MDALGALITMFIAAAALFWLFYRWTAVNRCEAILCDLERWTIGEGKAPLTGDVPQLLGALVLAIEVRDRESACILRRARHVTVARAGILVGVAREAAVTERAAEFLGRAAAILEAAARLGERP